MEDIATLFDLFNGSYGPLWSDAINDLLEAGYTWEYSADADVYRLIDLSAYFEC